MTLFDALLPWLLIIFTGIILLLIRPQPSQAVGLGLVYVIFALFVLGYDRVRQRLRKQVDELRSLSVMSQTMRANLEFASLLNMIYLQVNHLLDTDNFLVALYHEQELEYPLVIERGQQVQRPASPRDSKTRSLLHHVLDTQEPLLIPSDVAGHAHGLKVTAPDKAESWIGVPLLASGRLLGTMSVTSTDPAKPFTPDSLRLLNIVAANASVAIENALFYQQQRARVTQLATLNQVLALLTGTLSFDAVLDTVISSASAISGASAVTVYLFWDEAKSSLALVRSAGLSDQFQNDPPDPLLAREWQDSNQQSPLVVTDVREEPHAAALRNQMVRESKQAWVELPLSVGGVSLGLIVLYYDAPRAFTDEEIELLRTFANQVAQAISNARLYAIADETLERRVGQLLALAAIGHELTATLDMATICQLILSHALDGTRTSVGLIALVTQGQEVEELVSYGYPPDTFLNRAVVLQGVAGRVIRSGQSALIVDTAQEADYLALLPTTRSQLVIPILRSNVSLGFIVLENDRVGAFSDEDEHFVTQLTNQAVIAIDNARLFGRIAEARDRLQVILNAMQEAIILINADGAIVLANPRVDLIGLVPEDLLRKNVNALLERADLDFAERLGFRSDAEVEKLVKNLRARSTWTPREPLNYNISVYGDERHIQRQVIPLWERDDDNGSRQGAETGALLVFYDQTEQFELAQAREDLSRMIIHDLRSPLTAVTTSLKLMTEIVPKESDIRPLVETTADSSRRVIRKILSRVDSLLDISRMESGFINLDTKPTELATLVDSVCIELSPLAHELNITIVTEIPEDLPLLAIDADKVERVLLNLLDNALKFAPMGSSVTIRAHPDSDKAGFSRTDVIDCGPGVPDEYKTRLFDRFVQVEGRSGKRRGSGLGLSFCRLVAEGHGGRIWIEDNPGGGSIFSMTLPVVNEEALQSV
jgi:K+-sensing histidine kinase KdpD